MAIESPRYQTVHKDNKFEIREYEEYILAEEEGKKYIIAFTMPPKYTRETLPDPVRKTTLWSNLLKISKLLIEYLINIGGKQK